LRDPREKKLDIDCFQQRIWMNDFASQLGKLQQTAAAAKAQNSPKSDERDETVKKRRRQNKSGSPFDLPSQNRMAFYSTPHDIDKLTVDISFLCIGAQKSGTTWLHEILRRHPGLSLPVQKEVHFWDWNRRKGLDWYSNQFPSETSKEPLVRGEITPCYVVLEEHYIREIKTLFPRVKLIFIARDPVERAWSALLMELRNAVRGMEAGKFSIDDNANKRSLDKFNRDADPEKYNDSYFMERLMHSSHTKRSDYATSLRLWLDHFSKDQLLILNFRDISEKPRDFIKEITRFIGVESETFLNSISDDDLSQRINSATTTTSSLRPALRTKIQGYLESFLKDFNALLNELGYSWRLADDCSKDT